MEAPSLMQALAMAQLIERRCRAAVAEVELKCSDLAAQAEGLRRQAEEAVPRPPLFQLVEEGAAAGPQADAGPVASPEALQAEVQALAMWQQAAAVLPPDLLPALASVQRYLLLGALQRGPGGGPPIQAALERTPVVALLQLGADILQAHAAASAAGGSQQPAVPSPPAPLSAAHGQLLASASACLAQLCDHPGLTAVGADYDALQHFCTMLLHLVAAPPAGLPEEAPAPDQQPAAGAAAARQQGEEGGAPERLDVGQPTCQLAQHVLGELRQSASAGTVLLSCTAPHTRDCMAALVGVVTGEQLLPSAHLDLGSGGASQPGDATAAAAEEARLLHAFAQLSQQLSAGLRLLPRWTHVMGLHNDAFMQDLAAAILSARDASELISVTHPAVARRMQRVAAQMVGALQAIASDEQGGM